MLQYVKKAETCVAAAKKHASKTCLKNSNLEQASIQYREAIKWYRMTMPTYNSDFIDCLSESATVHKELGSLNLAAKDLEAAFQIAKEEKNNLLTVQLLKRASSYYRANSQIDKAASVLLDAAMHVKSDVKMCTSILDEACRIFDEEKSAVAFHQSTFAEAITYALKNNMLDIALNLIKRQNVLCALLMDMFEESLYKNYLNMMIIMFSLADYEKAEVEFQESVRLYPNFISNENHHASLLLLNAYHLKSQKELVTAISKTPQFKYINNQCARLANKLQFKFDTIHDELDEKKDCDLLA